MGHAVTRADYNFAVIPFIASRHPLWEDQLDETAARSELSRGYLLDDGRQTIATTPLDAEPNLILDMPGDSLAPLCLAIGMSVIFAAALFHAWLGVALGVAICIAALMAWFWPRRPSHAMEPTND